MIRLNIVCEGETEERFVKELLAAHLLSFEVHATPHNLGTGTQYAKLRKKVVQWLKHESLQQKLAWRRSEPVVRTLIAGSLSWKNSNSGSVIVWV